MQPYIGYHDGTFSFSSSSGALAVGVNATVSVLTGAAIAGGNAIVATEPADDGITALGPGTTITVSGGTVTGGAGAGGAPGGNGIVARNGVSLTVSGGTVTAGLGGAAAIVRGDNQHLLSAVSISGGTFTGATGLYWTAGGVTIPPEGPDPTASATSTLAVSGGTFAPDASGAPGYAVSLGLGDSQGDGCGAVTISGGSFAAYPSGSLSIVSTRYSTGTATISGGNFAAGWHLQIQSGSAATVSVTGTGLSYTSGTLTGTLGDSHAISVAVTGAFECVTNTATLIVFGAP